MNASVKKLFNIISYTLNVFFIVILIVGLKQNRSHQNNQADRMEEIKSMIVERERADIPLLVQRFTEVQNITIDSMVITKNTRPYEGYLVTTWDYNCREELSIEEWADNGYDGLFKYTPKTETKYVKIINIMTKLNGELEWGSNWESAYLSIVNAQLQ